VWLLPVMAALTIYARTLGFTFVWDDLDLIVRNAGLHGSDWAGLLTQDFWRSMGGATGMWRPLVTLSYRLDGVLSGWQPWLFHGVNALAHAAASGLVAKLARVRGVPVWAAAAAGILYATTPALSESTAWIAGRTDAFAALFTLAALWLARRARARPARWAHAGVLACVGLALLAKETALVLPLLLLADAADERAPGGPTLWRSLVPSLAVVLVWAVVHRALVAAPAHTAAPGAAAGVAALLWAHLAWLVPWAAHSPLLDVWHAPAAGVALAAWLALAGVTVLGVELARRRVGLALPLALLIAPLLPVAAASVLESGVRYAERALTLPAAGLALGLTWLAARVSVRARGLVFGVLGTWIVLQCAATYPAVGAWRDEESRIRRIASVRPRDLDALLGLADLLSNEGRDSEALEWIARAEVVAPGDAGPWLARASVAYRSGHLEEALAAADAALARSPDDLAAGMVRVRALARLGRGPLAVAAGEELVGSHPEAAAAAGALGTARLAAGDAAGALDLLTRSSAQLLDDAGLAWDLGRAALTTGDVALARTAFERAVVAAPEFYEAWLGVADTRSRLGDAAAANVALDRAATLPGAQDGRVAVLRARFHAR
jgi:tetratricopeptide (TPR) repeat protein